MIENKNPLPGGDVLLQPLNMAPMGSNDNDSGAKAQRSKEGQLPDTETWRAETLETTTHPDPLQWRVGKRGARRVVLAPVVRDCAERVASAGVCGPEAGTYGV